MPRIVLKSTDLLVSRLCLGTMAFGTQSDEHESARILGSALAAGINFIDTANIYGNGASETTLGQLLRGRRHDVVLASKAGMRLEQAPEESGLGRDALLRAVETSLRRLGTDYLDLYYLHQPDYSVPIDETLRAMDDLVRSGKVRYPANSNFSSWQVCELLNIAADRKYLPAAVSQVMYNLLARRVEHEFLPMAGHFGVTAIAYNPLAGGLLTGKQSRDRPIPGSRFDRNQTYLSRYWHAEFFDAVAALAEIARTAGRSLVSLSLNWLLCHTHIDGVVIGASSQAQLHQNLAAIAEGPLPAEAVAACDRVWSGLRGAAPQYYR